MKYYLLVLVFQILFNIFKVLEIKYTYENKLNLLLYNSIYINLVSLGTVYWSLNRLFEGDWWVILFYIAGSVIGKWIAMTQNENIRYKIYKIFGKKKGSLNRQVKEILKISRKLFIFEIFIVKQNFIKL